MQSVISEYLKCGEVAFDAYAGPMGNQGWEMVSYQQLEYTAPGTGVMPSVVVDYGYEVMWKRPKN